MVPGLSEITNRPIIQVCWSVPDVDEAALGMSALMGAGPWFVMRNIPLDDVTYRGKSSTYDHTAGLGQWGEVQIELHHQNCDAPSAAKDLYPDGRTGILHVTWLVDDVEEEIVRMAAKGFPTVFTTSKGTDMYTAWFDTAAVLGTYVEVYQANATVLGGYDAVRQASIGWTGEDPIRGFDALPASVIPAAIT